MAILDSVINYIQDVFKKAADRKFKGDLAQLANSSPEGKKAAQHLEKSLKDADEIMDTLSDDMAALGWSGGTTQPQNPTAVERWEAKITNRNEEIKMLAKITKRNEEAGRKTEEKERKKEMKLKSQIEQLHIGMTKDMVLDVFGEAGSEKKTVARSGEKLTWFYNGKKTSRGNMRYLLSIKIKNNEVVSWSQE